VLTHFSARYDDVTQLAAQAAARAAGAKIIAANDLERIAVPKRRAVAPEPHAGPRGGEWD
jgi:ribonuclease Z